MLRCEACGRDNPETNKFCGECAAPLSGPEEAHEVRKTVSIVFCDVVGSTSMGEALDPESLRRIMGRYFDAMRTAIEHHGGTVEKFIGDAVMAVFGVPQVHEDDALRAVRAASDMRGALSTLNATLDRDHRLTMACRIGVNTGEVVAGAGNQKIVTGDAVNVAARLEQAASPGEILLGEDTYALVRDAVIAESIGAVQAKGKTEPVSAFRLIEVTPGTAGFARHLDAPMVGRERELMLLWAAFERGVTDRACQVLTILGPAGVGKSRLIAAFIDQLGDRAAILRGRCLPYGEGITFNPLVEALIDVANLSETDTPQSARAKLAALVGAGELADRIAERVGQAIGIPGSQTAPEETLWAIRVLLERLAAERPLVFVIDDLQWAEPKFLELVEHVADLARDAPILLACMARPELLDDHPGWAERKPNATSLLLPPLGPEECGRLVANVLADGAVDEEVRARVTEVAAGLPLFAEEITWLLVDDGRLVLADGRWVAKGDLSDMPIPRTISALLAARLDMLPPNERRVIDIASVMGQIFYPDAVLAFADVAAGDVNSGITALVAKRFVGPERSDLPARDALAFRHLLIRDAAYGSISKQRRAELHEHFADWLESVAGLGVAEQHEIVGHHLERAYRYREQLGPVGDRGMELAARAETHLESAGRKAAARGDLRAATGLLERAISLLPPGSAHRVELLVQRGSQLIGIGELREAEAVLAAAIDGAQMSDEKVIEWRARVEHAYVQIYLEPEGKTEAARLAAERAIPILEERGDDGGLARAWELMSVVRWLAVRVEDAAEAADRGLAHARRAGDAQAETRLLQWTLSFDRAGPTPVNEALRRAEEILAGAGGVRILKADALSERGLCLAALGRFEEGRALILESRSIVDELGLRGTLEDMTSWNLGILELIASDFEAAEQNFLVQYRDFERMQERSHLSTVAGHLGRIRCERGAFDDGQRYSRICEENAASDDLHSQVLWRSGRGRALSRRGEPAEAEALAREGVALSMRTDFIALQADATMDLGDVLQAIGRPEQSVPVIQEAIDLYRRKGIVPMVARAEAALQKLVDST